MTSRAWPRPSWRTWRSSRGWLGLLLCVGLSALLVLVRPDLDADRFSKVDPGPGGWGRSVAFDARIDRVTVTTAVAAYADADPLRTEQRWVVVEYRVAAHRDRLAASNLWLITADGDRYAARPEFSGLGIGLLDAGFTGSGTVVFEVPPGALGNVVVRVGPLHPDRRSWDVVIDHKTHVPDRPTSDVVEPERPQVVVTR